MDDSTKTTEFILQLSGKENQPSLQKHNFSTAIAERQKKRFLTIN